MKISKELSHLYRGIRREDWNHGSWKLIADALQQAVAENLKMEFQNEHSDTQHGFPCIIDGNVCLDPRHDFITWNHWLADADKLLRGQQ